MTNQAAFFATSNELADSLQAAEFYEWQATAGYDTRPYYQAASGGVRLPVAHTVGHADRRQEASYGSDPVALLATIRTLYALGVEIVIPDYSGCNLDGETYWTPIENGVWAKSYESFRD